MIPERVSRALRSRKLEERAGAVEALARIETPEATALLVGLLRDRFHYVGELAARALAQRQDPDTAPALVEAFAWLGEAGRTRDPGCRIRTELAIALGNLREYGAADILFAGLRTVQVEPSGMSMVDTAVGLRGACALALAEIRPSGALLPLSLLLHGAILGADSQYVPVETSEAVARALGNLGEPAALPVLATRLANARSAPAEVVAACMDAIGALDPPEVVELLSPFLRPSALAGAAGRGGDGTGAFLAARAALALASTRRAEVLPLLLHCLAGAPDSALEPVAIAIANLRSDEARGALMRLAGDAPPPVRAAAVAALALFPDDEVRALLRRLAERDTSPKVREAARRAAA